MFVGNRLGSNVGSLDGTKLGVFVGIAEGYDVGL